MNTSRSLAIQVILACLFVLVGTITLGLAAPTPALTLGHLVILVVGWTLVWGGAFYWLKRRRPEIDLAILPPIMLLTGWGLLLLARTAPPFLFRQLRWMALSVGVLCAVASLPALPRLLRRYSYVILTAGLLLLTATLIFGVNPSGYGAELWLGLFGFYYQPSELLKLILIVYLAAYLSDHRSLLTGRRPGERLWFAAVGPMLVMVGLALLLLAWQDDLGAALLFYLTFLAMLYLAWGKAGYVILGLLFFAPVAYLGAQLSARVALRVSIWLNPWPPEQADRAFQILQSLFAMAAGGLSGQGLGQGMPTLIPAVHTDFVYAALIEEFGTWGGLALLALIALVVVRCMRLAQRAPVPFESLLAGGIGALLAIQTLVIVAGNTKMIPITGVTLPFLSYGGSSLLTTLAAVGLLLNISAPHPPPLDLALTPESSPPLTRTAARMGTALLLLLAGVALGTGYWSILRADALRNWITNPRYILAEARIQRGTIEDRRGETLASIVVDEQGFVDRTYPVPESAPVIGYTTLDYGTSGIEAHCDPWLRGDLNRTPWQATWDGFLHRPPHGQPVRLTLDARLQRTAQQQLSGQRGAALLIDTHTGEILALATSPTFTPTTVVTDWEQLRKDPASPLLNRVTQGLAQPGAALETVLLAETLQMGSLPPVTLPLTLPVRTGGLELTCQFPLGTPGWKGALASNCPAPFAELARQLDGPALAAGLARWGLTSPPPLELPTVAAAWNPRAIDPVREGLGQGNLLVTPLQLAGIAVTLGNNGTWQPLHLVADPQPGCSAPPITAPVNLLSPQQAAELRELWPNLGFGIGHLSQAQAGPNRTLTWFLGLNSAEVPRYAVVVLLENPPTPQAALPIARQLLQQALNP